MNKKGWLMTIAVTGFLIAVYILMQKEIVAKDSIGGSYYGNSEIKLMKAYQEGDEMLFNLEYFSREAFQRSLLRLGEKAGWSDFNDIPKQCFIKGFILLADYCKPDLRGQLKKEFMSNFNELISNFKKENNRYVLFSDDEVVVTDSFIEGKSQNPVVFESVNKGDGAWVSINPQFKIEINRFKIFTDFWNTIKICLSNKDLINMENCLKLYKFQVISKDIGGYYLLTVDTKEKIFYRGDVMPIEIRFIVQK